MNHGHLETSSISAASYIIDIIEWEFVDPLCFGYVTPNQFYLASSNHF